MFHWIQTRHGNKYEYACPKPEQICIDDIVHGLSNINRFVGHTRKPVSVLQHSLIVASLVPKEHELAALLHDAPEAYVGDCPSPLKALLGASFAHHENLCWAVICEKFRLPTQLPKIVKEADSHALFLEAVFYQRPDSEYRYEQTPLPVHLQYRKDPKSFEFIDNWPEEFRSKKMVHAHPLYDHLSKHQLEVLFRQRVQYAYEDRLHNDFSDTKNKKDN